LLNPFVYGYIFLYNNYYSFYTIVTLAIVFKILIYVF
jgi:hypothetical protein